MFILLSLWQLSTKPRICFVHCLFYIWELSNCVGQQNVFLCLICCAFNNAFFTLTSLSWNAAHYNTVNQIRRSHGKINHRKILVDANYGLLIWVGLWFDIAEWSFPTSLYMCVGGGYLNYTSIYNLTNSCPTITNSIAGTNLNTGGG